MDFFKRIMADLSDILQRLPAGISHAVLAQTSGMHPEHLRQIKIGIRTPKPATLAKIRMAVTRLRTRQTQAGHGPVSLYRALLVLACRELQLDASAVQLVDPAIKHNLNQAWKNAALARNLAQYLMNCGLGFAQVEVARASGVTRQALSLAMREMEWKREQEPDFEALVTRLERDLVGQP
jgi:transcriptional regulator with XRE-family HTH domain